MSKRHQRVNRAVRLRRVGTEPMSPLLRAKVWFNQLRPYERICLRGWCLRAQTYQHRCHLHQVVR